MSSPPIRPTSFASQVTDYLVSSTAGVGGRKALTGNAWSGRRLLNREEPYARHGGSPNTRARRKVFDMACWPRTSAPTSWRRRRRVSSKQLVRPVARELQRKYLMRSRDPNQIWSDRSRIALPNRVSTPEPDGRGLWINRNARNCLLPERHHLFRPADPGEDSRKSDPSTPAGRILFCRPPESLQGMELPLVPVAPSVYRKLG